MEITGLRIHPIKSCRGIEVGEITLTRTGPLHDREFMVVDADGSFVTQRTHAKMCLVATAFDGDHLLVSAPRMTSISVDLAVTRGGHHCVEVWGDRCTGIDQGEPANRFFSEYLGLECRLVRNPPNRPRMHHSDTLGESFAVGFADAYPLLVVSQASLDDLNGKLAAQGQDPVPMDRFRPNVVIDGSEPFVEDEVGWLRTGSADLQFVKRCARCPIIMTDQTTGARATEPYGTLMTYRRLPNEKKAGFGSNYIHRSGTTLRVGDRITAN